MSASQSASGLKHHDNLIIPVKAKIKSYAWIDSAAYKKMYQESIENPDKFWAEQAKNIDWIKPFTKVKNTSFGAATHSSHLPRGEGEISIKWFEDGQLNVSANCIDRHLATRGEQVAIIWEGDNPQDSKKITYNQLHKEVCKFANVLKAEGIGKGDRVIIYMPMIVESAYAMLACARIGAVHSVVFGGFSPASLRGRIEDCKSKLVITADEGVRGGKKIPLLKNVQEALKDCAIPQKVLVVGKNPPLPLGEGSGEGSSEVKSKDTPSPTLSPQGGGGSSQPSAAIYIDYHAATANVSDQCAPEVMNAEDPLFILYTSGSTGKPKGVLHTSGGYILYAALTHKYIFDYHDGDVYWCTADVGWITGHTYIVYGPLANGATTLMFEGVPNYPDWSRVWQVIDKHQVNIFYTAPTAIRSIMREGDEYVAKTSRKSLRVLGSVGEPINPEAWLWYYNVVGEGRCPIMDTWWQTETGGILITPLPGAIDLKPGSATLPFFGVQPAIVDNDGKILEGEAEGNLCILDSWPGQMRSVYGDHKRFAETYFSMFPGKYFSGDGARRDADGYYWITGRVDDVLKVSGHRIGTAEVESALVGNHNVAEAAVVGYPHDVKGQGIYAFVILKAEIVPSDELKKELVQWVRNDIGPIASPDFIQFSPGLPKTRSGKIMRRILRKIVENDYGSLGDTNTLLNPEVVEDLIKDRLNK